MRTVNETTKVGEFEYPISYQAFESIDDARAAWEKDGHNPEEVLLGILNAAQKQGALQGGKAAVRDALKEHGADSEEVAAAVKTHQDAAAGYVIGAPRGNSTGVTKKSQHEFGEAVTKRMLERGKALSQAELAELAAEYGISL